jgi:hypothetical protein
LRNVLTGLAMAAGLAGGLAIAEQLRDPTSWLRLRVAELIDQVQEGV